MLKYRNAAKKKVTVGEYVYQNQSFSSKNELLPKNIQQIKACASMISNQHNSSNLFF